jgi:uncharacterized protein (UPF0332 family)
MMTPSDSIKFLMQKAEDSIETAKNIAKPDFAVSRAYYGMFYAAEAALLTKELQFKKHSAVIGSFNKEFVREGVFPKEMSKMLEKAFDFRTQGDYGMMPVDPDEANAVLASAAEFVGGVRAFLKKEGFLPD